MSSRNGNNPSLRQNNEAKGAEKPFPMKIAQHAKQPTEAFSGRRGFCATYKPFLASSFPCSRTEYTPSHLWLTQTVETVEKVPFQKMIVEKWNRNTEKRLVFCVPNNILAIFEPVVGDFYEHFSTKGFFDSLVGRFASISLFSVVQQVYNS